MKLGTKIRLLDENGKTVKNATVKYEKENVKISIPEIKTGNYTIEAKVSSKAGKDTIQKQIYISKGNQENTIITFDKGIYKPGDTVNFRALLTNKENEKPLSKETNISIYDGNDNKVYNENVKTSEYGILSGSFKLANEVNSGAYKLVVKTNSSETTKSFKVNPYITPKYEIKINTDKLNYKTGETATINLSAKYFFGEPVANAKYTVYIDGKQYKNENAKEDGTASITYEIQNPKTYTVKVEAVDSSNYFVEQTSTFTAGTDIFEINLRPEYGTLISGVKNDVYVFTNTPDEKPVKTYVTVTSEKFSKQIATDENGIGKFSIDMESLNSYSYNAVKKFNITAENMNGEKVKKNIELKIQKQSTLISTDKVKYKQGEDINLKISSITENSKNIYFMKNDKLIKMISTDQDSTTVNLDDIYGLIDIYIKDNNSTGYSYNNSNTFKKTIFIKPEKALNIGIQTDKAEYKPGEDIKISFETTDENKTKVDTALLVSMLDNSILSLANNDLSIDNIKLALQDIKFSNELDAATLYSSIIDDSSEQALMALLLKQGNKNININEKIIHNYEEKQKAMAFSILCIVILVIIAIIYACIKVEKCRNIMKHVINIIMYTITVSLFELCIIEEYFWRINYNWWIFAFTTAICLGTYILWVSKLSKKMIRTSISILITAGLIAIISILAQLIYVNETTFWQILAGISILFLISAIVIKINEKKQNPFIKKLSKEALYILKYIGAVILSGIIGSIIYNITNITAIQIPITIVGLYILNYLFNKPKKENKEESTKKISLILLIGIIIGILIICIIISNIISNLANGLNDEYIDDRVYLNTPTTNTRSSTDNYLVSEALDMLASEDGGAASEGTVHSMSGIKSLLPSINSRTFNNAKVEKSTEVQANEQKQENIDTNIRNVFLESMCFIPELITKQGTADLNLTLSDNITTWTVQTIGNTKDGRVGYGKLDTVKVFKNFFADFELPKNLVETDKVSIPVTIYNYTKEPIEAELKIKQEDWFKLENNNLKVNIDPENTKMTYIPITILKTGDNKFRVEVTNNNQTDIIEKELKISPKGYKVEKVISSGTLEGSTTEDILILEKTIENTAKAKLKIYSTPMAQTIDGMENIFRMPTGCFEQISSSLYPSILALKYIQDNGIVNEEIKAKALNYISSGYQKLLTYEVRGESGGYSLYGGSPAETVLTAYGLMELSDLKKVYNVDENVLQKMKNFLYTKQNPDGSFTITGYHLGGAVSHEKLALNAYITWALSESDPTNEKLKKSIEYLKGKLDNIEDNYTLALIANTFANVKESEANDVLKRLINNIKTDGDIGYITSKIVDYYGSRTNSQTIQTVALTSMALSKTSKNNSANQKLINYIIKNKDTMGTWHSTQATILALKALNEINDKNKLEKQTITAEVNSNEQQIEVKENPLDVYELTFENLGKENKLNINLPRGKAYYEVTTEYYIPYENINNTEDKIEAILEANTNLKVNEILDAKIKLINRDQNQIYNGMVTITIPQGFTTIEESLALLQAKGTIEKYEMNYNTVNIYLRNFDANQKIDLNVKFRALYPVDVTGLSIRAYDYYNPEIQGTTKPIQITVTN